MPKNTEDRLHITDENFGDLVIESLQEARAIIKGDLEPTRRVRRGAKSGNNRKAAVD